MDAEKRKQIVVREWLRDIKARAAQYRMRLGPAYTAEQSQDALLIAFLEVMFEELDQLTEL